MIEITSSKNPAIKLVKSLYQKKHREKEQKFVIEGYKTIRSAIDGGAKCLSLYATREEYERIEEQLQQASAENGMDLYLVTSPIFKEIASTETPQGILSVMEMPSKLDEDDLSEYLRQSSENESILMLDRIQDPGNMGTIIRTADAAGIKKIILIKGCVDIYNEKVVRSTMGSIFSCHFYEVDNIGQVIDILKRNSYTVIASALENSILYSREGIFASRSCLIIGNEGNGVQTKLIEESDFVVKIPIVGHAESLNAAVAAGILMYKMLESKGDL